MAPTNISNDKLWKDGSEFLKKLQKESTKYLLFEHMAKLEKSGIWKKHTTQELWPIKWEQSA